MSVADLFPRDVIQQILVLSGSGGPAAAMTCKALAAMWRNALTVVSLAVRFLMARYGAVTAARHMYMLSQHSQLLAGANAIDQDGIMLALLRQLCHAGAELGLHDALLLMQAARAGHSRVLCELLHVARPSIFALSRALTAAAEAGHCAIVRQLLKAGAPPAAYQSAALTAAAAGGNASAVYLLCAAGADPTAEDSRALRRAVQLGHVDAATVLLQYGADARALCSAALSHACTLPAASSAASSNAAGPSPSPAASEGSRGSGGGGGCVSRVLALVEMLLRSGADARAHGRAALEAAASRGHAGVVRALLGAGADPTSCNSSALVAASIQGHTEVVGVLLESGADPWDVTDLALRTASERGHRPVLRVIRQAQRAASNAEGSLQSPSATRSVAPPVAGATGHWSAQSMRPSTAAAAAFMATVGGGGAGVLTMEAAAFEAFLSNI